MLMLAFRTDKPIAELFLMQGEEILASHEWEAHRQLSDTLLVEIHALLARNNIELTSVQRIAVYQGPGSFTGLRIGFSVANALAYGLDIPVVTATGDDWLKACTLKSAELFKPVVPFYGQDAHITQPKK